MRLLRDKQPCHQTESGGLDPPSLDKKVARGVPTREFSS